MRFLVGHLVDAANVSVEGKLNLTGIFQVIHTANLPCHLPCSLVCLFETAPYDMGKEHAIHVELIDQDGRLMNRLDGMKLASPNMPAVALQTTNIIISFRPLSLFSFGPHSFKIFLEDRLVGDVVIHVAPAIPQGA